MDGSLGDGFREGETCSWEDVAKVFDFKPDYLAIAGGMISRPRHGALVLITHPDGAPSFDCHDEWDGDELIYNGRGQTGDQRFEGPNRDLGENVRTNFVFEPDGARRLRFVGCADCVAYWRERASDARGRERDVLRYGLRFARN